MDDHELDKILGIPFEERCRLQQQAIDEMNDKWEKELDEQNKAKSLAMMEKNSEALNLIAETLVDISESNENVGELSYKEIAFLYYINKKKTNLTGIAGYWLYSSDYRINISATIGKFLRTGLIRYSDIEYDLNKTTIPELKEYSEKHGVCVKGNKNKIITDILKNISYNTIEKNFGGKYYLITDKGMDILTNNEAAIFFHCYGNKIGISLSDADKFKNNHKKMSAKDIAVEIIRGKFNFYKKEQSDLGRNYYYCLSEVYKYFNDFEKQLNYLLIVCYFDYKFSLNRDIEPFVSSFIKSISELITNLSLSKDDFDNYLERCKAEIGSDQNFIQFKECILSDLNKGDKKIQVDDTVQFLEEYYKNGKRKDISPYYMNYIVNELIDDLENEFAANMNIVENSAKKEQVIIYIMNDILNDNTMSKYQLSLTCKKLGDYYYMCKLWDGALQSYTIGLDLNSKLTVKKKLKDVQEKSRG